MSLYEKYPVSLYNTLSRTRERFEPLHSPHVGLYVCGPTVYGPPHLGHGRSALTFDLVFRYLRHLGYQVRYVRNITDVGHLEHEVAGAGEDRIAKQARLAKLEPMEVVQIYTLAYREALRRLNALPPSIEPQASGHIIEQIEFVRRIAANGYAYETNGSVYFDLAKYARKHRYGELSGKVLDDLLSGTRDTAGLDEKRSPFDFALWKRAEPEHLMKWPSPWGEGFPGWHIECSVMSTKYLGETFDIHGAGMDLEFPHHEAEIAQSTAALGHASVRYWMHNNMITIGGQKMAKSLGNYITLDQLFSRRSPGARAGVQPDDDALLRAAEPLPQPRRLLERAPQGCGKGLPAPDERARRRPRAGGGSAGGRGRRRPPRPPTASSPRSWTRPTASSATTSTRRRRSPRCSISARASTRSARGRPPPRP